VLVLFGKYRPSGVLRLIIIQVTGVRITGQGCAGSVIFNIITVGYLTRKGTICFLCTNTPRFQYTALKRTKIKPLSFRKTFLRKVLKANTPPVAYTIRSVHRIEFHIQMNRSKWKCSTQAKIVSRNV
jgi:hypothetical protein